MTTLPHTQRLLEIMAKLRDKEHGCPWDIEQNYASIVPYTIEEAYEVAEAIEQNDLNALKGELGDLLLQVVFHAQMANEESAFDFEAVAKGICDKMVRRHPHVFGEADIATARPRPVRMRHRGVTPRELGDPDRTVEGVRVRRDAAGQDRAFPMSPGILPEFLSWLFTDTRTLWSVFFIC